MLPNGRGSRATLILNCVAIHAGVETALEATGSALIAVGFVDSASVVLESFKFKVNFK